MWTLFWQLCLKHLGGFCCSVVFLSPPGILLQFFFFLRALASWTGSCLDLKASRANPRCLSTALALIWEAVTWVSLFAQVPHVQKESDHRFPLPHHHLLSPQLPGCVQQQRSGTRRCHKHVHMFRLYLIKLIGHETFLTSSWNTFRSFLLLLLL